MGIGADMPNWEESAWDDSLVREGWRNTRGASNLAFNEKVSWSRVTHDAANWLDLLMLFYPFQWDIHREPTYGASLYRFWVRECHSEKD